MNSKGETARDRFACVAARPFLYAVLDASLVGERSLSEWAGLLAGEGGAPILQWRFKELSDAKALEGAHELRAATARLGRLFVVNDRPDIARIVGADGVHLGQDDLEPDDVRALLPGCIIGVSTHNREQFERALKTSSDYIAVGPVFATQSKARPDPMVGTAFVSWASKEAGRPVCAIGGIDSSNVESVVRAGARGIAVISDLMKSPAPNEAASRMQALIETAPR